MQRNQLPQKKMKPTIILPQTQKAATAQRLTDNLIQYTLPANIISEDFQAPCIVHRTARSYDSVTKLSKEKYDLYYGSWSRLLPQFCMHVLWYDASITDLVRVTMPDALEDYLWLKTGAERGDFARMLAVFHFGGIYADNDVELRREPKHWTLGEHNIGLIVGIEFDTETMKTPIDSIVQFTFAAIPRHPIIGEVLRQIVDNIHTERTTGLVYYRNFGRNMKIVARTGPYVLTRVLVEHFKAHNCTIREICRSKRPFPVPGSDVLVLPQWSFKPDRKGSRPAHPVETLTKHYNENTWTVKKRKYWARTPASPTPQDETHNQ